MYLQSLVLFAFKIWCVYASKTEATCRPCSRVVFYFSITCRWHYT